MPAKLEQVLVSIDIGKKRDYSAIAGIEKWQNKWAWPYESKDDGEPYYRLKFLERLPLGTTYDLQIEAFKWVYDEVIAEYKEKNVKPNMVVDATGVGDVILDNVKKVIPAAYGIYIHGGRSVSRDGSVCNVPKADLAMVVQVLMQSSRLTYASNILELEGLKKELLAFSYKTNIATGHTQFEAWRESDHDDRVLAVACGLWWAEKRGPGRLITNPATMAFGEAIRGGPVNKKWIGDKEEEKKEPIIWAD